MPELPEVETTRTALYDHLVGQTITAVTVNLPKVTANLTPADFAHALTHQTITDFTRRGKFLTLWFQSGDSATLHLRMTGTLTIDPLDLPCAPHTNLILTLANGTQLRFTDSRGFGKWWFTPAGQPDPSGIQNLGPEPHAITVAALTQMCHGRQCALKTLLLDQHNIAGIGNIYADEICFRAHVLPIKPAGALTPAEIQAVAREIPAVISEFIRFHHVSFAVYNQSRGTSYQTDTNLKVYGHAGDPCPQCGTPLTGARVGQRSTVFCTQCQH